MLKILCTGYLVDRLACLRIGQDNYEGLYFGINLLQVKTDFPDGDIPEPVKVNQMTAAEKPGKTDKLRPQRVVYVDSAVAADHFGKICREVGCTRRNPYIKIKRIELRLEKAVHHPRGENSSQRASLYDQRRI
jgi:hypothetical protein